jgi:hypothetical protein
MLAPAFENRFRQRNYNGYDPNLINWLVTTLDLGQKIRAELMLTGNNRCATRIPTNSVELMTNIFAQSAPNKSRVNIFSSKSVNSEDIRLATIMSDAALKACKFPTTSEWKKSASIRDGS